MERGLSGVFHTHTHIHTDTRTRKCPHMHELTCESSNQLAEPRFWAQHHPKHVWWRYNHHLQMLQWVQLQR